MSQGLLTCLRGAGQRLRPAIAAQQQRRPWREIFVGSLRVFSPILWVPWSIPKNARLLLPSYPSVKSKAGAAYRELKAAGMPEVAIWVPRKNGAGPWDRVRQVAFRLPCALWAFAMLRARSRRLDRCDIQVILGRQIYRKLMRRFSKVTPIIISDVSPGLHMLWSAALAEGNGAIWWQDDYHHRGPLPYPVSAAAVLNQYGLDAVRTGSPDAFVVIRKETQVKPLRVVPTLPRVGVATNASFVADETQRRLLESLRQALGVSELRIRLHPNSRINAGDFPESWVQVAPPDELLEDFAKSLDLVIVGNSAVQLRLLCEGVPVLHVAGLDPHGFDLYGYVKCGFAFGAAQLEGISPCSLKAFYADPNLAEEIRDYVNVRKNEGLGDLQDLVQSERIKSDGQSRRKGR